MAVKFSSFRVTGFPLLALSVVLGSQNFEVASPGFESPSATTSSPSYSPLGISDRIHAFETSTLAGTASSSPEEFYMGDNLLVTEGPVEASCAFVWANASADENTTFEDPKADNVTPPVSTQPDDTCTETPSAVTSGTDKARSRRRLIDMGTVSAGRYDALTRVTAGLSLALQGLGVLVNAFNVAVYVQPGMRNACSTYLAALSASQLLSSLLATSTDIARFLYGSRGVRELFFLVSGLYISNLLLSCLLRLSFTLTLIVSVMRFVAVAFPLKAGQLHLNRRPGVIIGCVVVVIVLIHVLTIGTKYEIFPVEGGHYSFKYSDFYISNRHVIDTVTIIIRVVLVYVFLPLILFINLLTTIFLRRHRKKSSSLKSNRDTVKAAKTDTQTTIAIVVATFLYVSLSLPTHVNVIVSTFSATFKVLGKEHYLYLTLSAVFGVLDRLSNTVDFFSYVILSSKYRRTLGYLLRCCFPSKRPQLKPCDGAAFVTTASSRSSSGTDAKPDQVVEDDPMGPAL